MNHVDEGTIQGFLDAELAETERYAVGRHLAACSTCASDLRSLREMDREFRTAMALVDVHAPVVDPFAARRRHRASLVFGLIPVQLARAALLALAVVGAVSAAIPGSPLRRWIEDVFTDEPVVVPPVTPAIVPEPVAPTPEPQLPVGFGPVYPQMEDGQITIHLHDPAPGVEIRVRLIDAGGEVAVSWTDGAETVRRETSPGAFHLHGVSAGVVTVDIPRNARLAGVEVDQATWWRFEQGAGVTVSGPNSQTSGSQTTFRVRN